MAQKRTVLLVLGIATLAGGCSLFLCWSQFGCLPHISDEISYVFQGRILASGHLALDPPPFPEMFEFGHILITGDRWCSIYPPGWPALLAIGWWIRAPWVLNPLLLFLSVLTLFRLARLLYDERTALLSVVLFAASPFVLEMHAGFLSHPALLCATLWTVIFLITSVRKGMLRHAFLAGLCAGACGLIRPFSAAALLAPFGVWFLFQGSARRHIPIVLAGILPAVIVSVAYNHPVFGSAFTSGYRLDPEWHDPAFSPAFLAENLAWYLREMNARMWEWPFPNLLVFLPLFWPGRSHTAEQLREATSWMLAASAFSVLVAYSFYYYRDIVLGGPRFLFESMGFLAILAARALSIVSETVFQRLKVIRPAAWLACFAALAGLSLSIRLPQQWMYHSRSYHGQSHELAHLVRTLNLGDDSLILVGGNRYVIGTFYFENSLHPGREGRVFVRDVPGLEREARKLYPRPDTWRISVDMKPLAGPNTYADRWVLRDVRIEKLNAEP